MKILLVSLAASCALFSMAFASEDASPHGITGHGQAMQSCDVITFESCQLMLQQQADQQAARDADTQCGLLGGHLESPYLQCSRICTPMAAPPYPAPPVFTSCDSDCYGTCLDTRSAE